MTNIEKNKISFNDSLSKTVFLSEKIVRPKRDWRILVILFAVFLIVSIGFDFYMYQQVSSGDMYVDVNRSDVAIESLKKSDLQKILDNFDNKKTIITTLKIKNLVDPSI